MSTLTRVVDVNGAVVFHLEFDPGGGLELAALDVAFPGCIQEDRDGGAGVDDGGKSSRLALAGVGSVVFEEVEGFLLAGFVF